MKKKNYAIETSHSNSIKFSSDYFDLESENTATNINLKYSGNYSTGYKYNQDKKVYEKYLEQLGWIKHKQPRAYDYEDGHSSNMSKYTVNELIDKLDGDKLISGGCPHIVVSVANHLTCLEDNHGYQIMDTWNCGHKCVGNYWTKE